MLLGLRLHTDNVVYEVLSKIQSLDMMTRLVDTFASSDDGQITKQDLRCLLQEISSGIALAATRLNDLGRAIGMPAPAEAVSELLWNWKALGAVGRRICLRLSKKPKHAFDHAVLLASEAFGELQPASAITINGLEYLDEKSVVPMNEQHHQWSGVHQTEQINGQQSGSRRIIKNPQQLARVLEAAGVQATQREVAALFNGLAIRQQLDVATLSDQVLHLMRARPSRDSRVSSTPEPVFGPGACKPPVKRKAQHKNNKSAAPSLAHLFMLLPPSTLQVLFSHTDDALADVFEETEDLEPDEALEVATRRLFVKIPGSQLREMVDVMNMHHMPYAEQFMCAVVEQRGRLLALLQLHDAAREMARNGRSILGQPVVCNSREGNAAHKRLSSECLGALFDAMDASVNETGQACTRALTEQVPLRTLHQVLRALRVVNDGDCAGDDADGQCLVTFVTRVAASRWQAAVLTLVALLQLHHLLTCRPAAQTTLCQDCV